jgi:release factor glutamine methyltransferase
MSPRSGSNSARSSASGSATDSSVRSQLLASAAVRLGSDREARWIVEEVERRVDIDRSDRIDGEPRNTEPDRTDPVSRIGAQVAALVDRRVAGEPLQYVLGRWAFRSLDLVVDARVLVPRPETEQVVEVALAELERMSAVIDIDLNGSYRQEQTWSPVAVDLGTGSGVIGLALSVEGGARHPELQVWATDGAGDALDVARLNVERMAVDDQASADRIRLVQGSWFDALPADLVGRVDLIVSNPPYVSEAEFLDLDSEVRQWEPRGALVSTNGNSGVGGTGAIELIVAQAPRWLGRSGTLVVEIAPGQAYAAIDAARRAGFATVSTERDLAGRIRMLVARR